MFVITGNSKDIKSKQKMAQKVEAQGGIGGDVWDDGAHDGVRKVHVGQGLDGVSFINVVYENGSQEVVGGEHGKKSLIGIETVRKNVLLRIH